MTDQIKKYQKQLEDISGTPTFCVLPWIHLATRPNGDMRLCCTSNTSGAGVDHEIGLVKEENGKPSNFSHNTPLNAFNNEYMRSVRKTMMEGNIPASCTGCFKEESNGIVSKRLWEAGFWKDEFDFKELLEQTAEDGSVPENLYYLDLRLGHTCNLKCIMCSPHDSSQWVADHKKVYPLFQHQELKKQMDWGRKEFNNFWHENPDFWKDIYEQIPNLKQLYFAGGEPLMIKEHRLFLEEIIRQGYADKIVVRYNSNGLLVDEEIIEIWKHFKRVKFAVSIDAVGNRNHYIRYPTDWDVLVSKLKLLDDTPSNIEVNIAVAVQILNIKHLPDLASWKIKQNFKKINLENRIQEIEAGGGIFNTHMVYIPTFLSIKCLPEQDKIEVRRKFGLFAQWLYDNYRQDEDFWKHNPHGWKRWQAIIDFMDSEDHSFLLPAFKEYIERMDKLRGLEFKSVFPELGHLL